MDSGQWGGGFFSSLFLSPDIAVSKIVNNGLVPLSLCLTVHVPLLAKQIGMFGGTSLQD